VKRRRDNDEVRAGGVYPAGIGRRVEQRGPQLGPLHALIADLAVRELLVLGGRCASQVCDCVREPRLLTEQQEQGEQQVQ